MSAYQNDVSFYDVSMSQIKQRSLSQTQSTYSRSVLVIRVLNSDANSSIAA